MAIPLEDNFNDIIGKAMRGLGLSDTQVANAAGLSPAQVIALRDGQWDETAARKIAPVLHLNADALAASGNRTWQPERVAVDGLAQFTTPYDDITVNSYLVWDPASLDAAAFDTGADCGPMLDLIEARGLNVAIIALTHTHGDHIFDLDRLKERTGARAIVSAREPIEGAEPVEPGTGFSIGKLQVTSRLTWGHSKGGLTYVIHGLTAPVAVVGDAIFAGSMGGGGVSYADALRTNREEIFTLPDETVLCPGHGPLTTVFEQRRHNPFFA
jgi:hydroxyacylglutathione hydrolase